MKTRIFLLLTALAMLFSFASCTACSNIDDTSSGNTSSDITSSLPSMSTGDSSNSIVSDIVSGVESMIPGDNSAASGDSASPTAALPMSEIELLDNTGVTWGPGGFFDDINRPTACLSLQEQYGKYSTYFIAPDTNQVYLTFDEGYENGYTSQILDTLKEKNVKAVFFVTMPYAKTEPELIQRMIDEGHIVGNHSNKHPDMTTVSFQQVQDEYILLHEYMIESFNYEMFLFRAPTGTFSTRTLAVGQKLGYTNVFWSFAYNDWDPENQPDPEKSLEKIVNRLHSGEIMLLHAVSKTNTDILGNLIDITRQKGFEFASFPIE